MWAGRSWNVAMNLYSESNGTSASAGQRAAGLLGVDTDLGGEHDERRLGRVADDRLVVGDGGVAAQREAEREAGEVGCRFTGRAEDGTRLGVAAALDLVPRRRR